MLQSSFLGLIKEPLNFALFIFLSCVIVLTIGLNLFIVIAVVRDKTLRNYTNIQFASMSCADLLVGSIAMPSMLISTFYGYWPLGDELCILFILGDFIGGNVSIITLAIISHHRLKCIRSPYKMKKITPFEMLLPALVVWPLIAAFWTLPTIYVIKNTRYKSIYINLRYCYYIYSFEYVLLVDIVAYICPMILLVYFQISIYYALKTKRSMIKPLPRLIKAAANRLVIKEEQIPMGSPLSHSNPSSRSDLAASNNRVVFELFEKPSDCLAETAPSSKRDALKSALVLSQILERKSSDDDMHKENCNHSLHAKQKMRDTFLKSIKLKVFKSHMSAIDQQIQLKHSYTKNKKVFRTLFFVTLYLIIFWLPWIVTWPIDAYCKCLSQNVYIITYWMEYSNSLMNSIILICTNQHFRKKFTSVFSKRR